MLCFNVIVNVYVYIIIIIVIIVIMLAIMLYYDDMVMIVMIWLSHCYYCHYDIELPLYDNNYNDNVLLDFDVL